MLLFLKGSVHSTDLPRTDQLRTDPCWTGRCLTMQLLTRCGNWSEEWLWELVWGWSNFGFKRGFCCHACVNEFRCSCFHLSQRSQPFVQRRDTQRRDTQRRQMQFQRRPNRQMDSQKPQGPVPHGPFRLRRKWWDYFFFFFFFIWEKFVSCVVAMCCALWEKMVPKKPQLHVKRHISLTSCFFFLYLN